LDGDVEYTIKAGGGASIAVFTEFINVECWLRVGIVFLDILEESSW
jgi:hypothetical protein